MSSGFTDWTDLGIFPLQDVEDGVPIGMRMAMVGGRVKKRPDAGAGGESLTTYAREDGLGTLGDIHPWLFWQTKEREKRPMGSWSMAWAALVTDAASPYYGGAAGVQPITKTEQNDVTNDPRYRVLEPAWHRSLPWQPEGMLALAMPSTDEVEPGSVMLSADRRLVAAGTSGPGQAGTTIVDMQPGGTLCMGDSGTPGQGGRHARLQGLVRVIALDSGSAGALGGADLNGLALNYGRSQQDGIVGFGMIYGPAGRGGIGGGGGPTTGQTRKTDGPITPGAGGSGPGGTPDAPGANSPGFGSGAGTANSDGPGGPNADVAVSVGGFGEFSPSAQGGYGIGFMAGSAYGPILHGCSKHAIGVDKDGHLMTSAHLSTDSYFWESGGRDGPIAFEGDYPEASASSIPTQVYLSWDAKTPHSFLLGTRPGKWRMWTTVPFVEAEEEDEKKKPPETEGPTPSTPTGPATPGVPTGPTTPGPGRGPGPGGAGGPGTGRPGAPGAPGKPGDATGPITPGGIPFTPPPPPPNPPWTSPLAPGAKRGPITPGGIPFTPPPPPPDDPWVSPLAPKGPITPGPAPSTPPNIDFDVLDRIGPVAKGTKFDPSDDARPFSGAIERRERQPAGVVPEVGGSAAGRDVGLYGVFHPFSTGFAAITLRPQLWIKGAPNFEHNPLLNPAAYRMEEKTRPTTLSIRAFGAQSQSGDWDYLTHPSVARPRGGNVNGGLLISPAEFEMEDYLGIASSVDTDNPVAATYAMLAPKVNLAFGKPTTTGRPSASSKSIHLDTAGGELKVSELDAAGAATGIAGFDVDADGEGHVDLKGTGSVGLPVGTTAQQPSSPSAGDFRYNSTDKAIEYYDGSAWQQPGAGATPNQDRAIMFPLLQGPGSYTTERVLFKCIPVAGDITDAYFHCTDVLTADSNNYWVFRIYRGASVVASLSNELSTISAGTLTSMGSLSNESFDGTQELRISVQTVHDTGNARSLNQDYLTFDIKMSID